MRAFLAFFLPALPAAADAQAIVRYALDATDTLRYHEVMETHYTVTGSVLIAPVDVVHESRVAVVLEPAGTARAWYQTVSRGPFVGPEPRVEDRTQVLRFEAHGRTEPLEPAEIQTGVSQLFSRLELDDFFLRLPDGPLLPGREWEDSLSSVRGRGDNRRVWTSVTRYRVLGDSVLGVHRVKVVETRSRVTLHVQFDLFGPYQYRLSGQEEGVAFFADDEGVFAGGHRRGVLQGRFWGGREGSLTLDLPNDLRYLNTIVLQGPDAAGAAR